MKIDEILVLSAPLNVCGGDPLVVVSAAAGQNVTLPCGDGPAADTLGSEPTSGSAFTSCWGRAQVPSHRCSHAILRTRRDRVIYRASPRYQLLAGGGGGSWDRGASLTIVHVRGSDAGLYGCRVRIPGWFNDFTLHVRLVVADQREREGTLKNTDQREREGTLKNTHQREREGTLKNTDQREREGTLKNTDQREREGTLKNTDQREREGTLKNTDQREREGTLKNTDQREREGTLKNTDQREREGTLKNTDQREREGTLKNTDQREQPL
ncbi:hypothetical protein NHX12_011917 [Muraenolepis orangiensis]|uniref:Immunoglobulin domain-containing protein n=1 Tax=Muraenolepis orangiensis TaxID=630683 RepID=A0A9Q0I773_9TELE|nr:hypothetical protein NHX12_011917 [Muraenolepis orangiensis]